MIKIKVNCIYILTQAQRFIVSPAPSPPPELPSNVSLQPCYVKFIMNAFERPCSKHISKISYQSWHTDWVWGIKNQQWLGSTPKSYQFWRHVVFLANTHLPQPVHCLTSLRLATL